MMKLGEYAPRFLRRLVTELYGRPTNFSWIDDNRVAGSGYPFTLKSIQWLKERGITFLLSLTEDSPSRSLLQTVGINHEHIPMINRMPERPEVLDKAVDIIAGEIKKGGKVAVHCLAGQGRTGMVLACYLVREKGLPAQKAIEYVKKERPGSLARAKQRDAVMKYQEYIQKKTIG
ncbi:MAG: dual specificity protein phosphatase family protein [Conexivisphaerales archaeon]